MKKALLFFILSFVYSTGSFANRIYTYEEKTSEKITITKWKEEEKDKKIEFIGEDDISITILKCSKNLEISSFYYKSKINPTEYLFSLEGKKLSAKGKVNNKSLDKEHFIDCLWIQQFGFGLKPFSLSKNKHLKFCLINPKDFSLQKMVATKNGIESLIINDKKHTAIKITVTLAGFKSILWKAKLWFDSTNGDFLKYVANKGPKTPTTTIILQSIKKEGFSDEIKKTFQKKNRFALLRKKDKPTILIVG